MNRQKTPSTKPAITLSEKERQLRNDVALPTAEDWKLFGPDSGINAALVECLNRVLLDAIERIEGAESKGVEVPGVGRGGLTWGQIADLVYPRISELAKLYPDAGLETAKPTPPLPVSSP